MPYSLWWSWWPYSVFIRFETLSNSCSFRTFTRRYFQAKLRAPLNHVVQSTSDEDNLPDITEEQTTLLINEDGESDESDANPNMCSKCHKYTMPRTFHCTICQACIVKRDHHNIWLDACIGESNHRFFFFGCIISIMALTLGTNLALTTICHPFSIGRIVGIPIFLPDDCSEVFDQFEWVNHFWIVFGFFSTHPVVNKKKLFHSLVLHCALSDRSTVSCWPSACQWSLRNSSFSYRRE